MRIHRHERNPIVIPGKYDWRRVATFNPAVIVSNGTFYMLERACSSLDPLKCQVGLLTGVDGLSFEHVCDYPVFTPEQLGAPRGTIEDPRVVEIDNRFYMTFVFRRYAATCRPTGTGVPRYSEAAGIPEGEPNKYQSGIAVSTDLKNWTSLGLITPPDIHDRDNVLFPDRVNGRYVMLRRPENYVGPACGCSKPSIWISYSEDLKVWSAPKLVATPQTEWEAAKIGAASPPVRIEEGWLTLYHGVDAKGVYRIGVMLLDGADPSRVVARSRQFIMEPEAYCEKVGLIIPNVIFPTANVVKGELLYVYYGCADTCISVATVPVEDLLKHALRDN